MLRTGRMYRCERSRNMKKPIFVVLYIIACICLIFYGPRIFSTLFGSGLKSMSTRAADARMEEGAYYPLRAVAGVQLGHILINYHIDEASGLCRPRFINRVCPSPQADPEELRGQQEELQEELHEHILLLRSGADADDSGFVTTEEGARFRELFEFGHQAANCFEMEKSGLGDETVRNLQDYRELVAGYPLKIRGFFPVVGDRSRKVLEE